MHRKLLTVFFSMLALLGTPFIAVSPANAQCNPHKIAHKYKPNLEPYKYDSYAYNDLTFGDKPQTVEVVFTAYSGEIYKLVLGTSLFDENVTVNIYDKSMRNKKRTKLYDNGTGIDNMFWSMQIDKPGVYYVDYEVPARGTCKSADGCVVMLIGYKAKDDDK
ncbi:MAG TPA: hypothetical protein VK806_09460 [Bacteroidia bacterium]|nr:hypothetical protein [Bacteroidia bacterium]